MFEKAYYRVEENIAETEDDQTVISSELPTANIEENDDILKDSPSGNITDAGQIDLVSIEESNEELKDSTSVNISDVVQTDRDDSYANVWDDDQSDD